jgi:N utilization substance protein B
MAKITRQEAREMLFALLFETEFRNVDDPVAVYELACDNREIPDDKYIRQGFFSIISRSDLLDAVITKYSRGWRAGRLSKVSRSVLRIAVYEMLFVEDIPMNVSISQAVELSLKYGEDKAKQFVNGVLSGLNKDVQARSVDAIIDEAVAAISAKAEKSEEVAESAEEAPTENA